jgi:hypothetical protein
MTELATFARKWLAPSTYHNMYVVENSVVHAALKQNMINLHFSSTSIQPTFQSSSTHKEWYLALGHVSLSFPALIKNEVRPSSAIPDSVIIPNKNG